MANSTQVATFPTGGQSGIVNGQIVPIFPQTQYAGAPGFMVQPSVAAGLSTLPQQVSDAVGAGAESTAPAAPAPPQAAILGVPSLLWWVLLAGAAAYLVLWHIHFRAGESASVGD